MCRKLNVIPNHYLLRHSTDDDIKLRHRYLSKNDCTAMGYEMKAILFSTIPTICKLTNKSRDHINGIVCNYYILFLSYTGLQDNSTFSKIDLEDNGMTGKHIHALAEMLLQNHYVSDIVSTPDCILFIYYT